MRWYRRLHWQIILGLILGIFYGILAASQGWTELTRDWIAPFGIVFINGLKLIAVPLILASLVTGVASLSDLKKLSRIGGKTIVIYVGTTAIAVTLGLLIVNVLKPGHQVPEAMRLGLQETYAADAGASEAAADTAKERGPLQLLVDLVPDIIRLVDLIMLIAPLGVISLIASTITTVAGDDLPRIAPLMGALGFYCLAVTVGLAIQMLVTYPVLLRAFTPMKVRTFYAGIAPAQLAAFSTSSSGATLPVTMERCEEKLGVSEEVFSFVLPLGATINMDDTGLYQAVAAVFIAQTLGMGLGVTEQLTIVLTAVLASIGAAGVPGAGIIMLVVILEAIGVPSAGVALISAWTGSSTC